MMFKIEDSSDTVCVHYTWSVQTWYTHPTTPHPYQGNADIPAGPQFQGTSNKKWGTYIFTGSYTAAFLDTDKWLISQHQTPTHRLVPDSKQHSLGNVTEYKDPEMWYDDRVSGLMSFMAR